MLPASMPLGRRQDVKIGQPVGLPEIADILFGAGDGQLRRPAEIPLDVEQRLQQLLVAVLHHPGLEQVLHVVGVVHQATACNGGGPADRRKDARR